MIEVKSNKFNTIYESDMSQFVKSDDINPFEKLAMKSLLSVIKQVFPGDEITHESYDDGICCIYIKYKYETIMVYYGRKNFYFHIPSLHAPNVTYKPKNLSELYLLINHTFYNLFCKLKKDYKKDFINRKKDYQNRKKDLKAAETEAEKNTEECNQLDECNKLLNELKEKRAAFKYDYEKN